MCMQTHLDMHTEQVYDWLTSVLWSTWHLVHCGRLTKLAKTDNQFKFIG